MNETLHANIFFFITSVAVVVVTLMMLVILWYVIVILKEVRAIVSRLRKASENLERDIDFLRGEVKSTSARVVSIVGTIVSFATGFLTQNKKHTPAKRRFTKDTDTDAV